MCASILSKPLKLMSLPPLTDFLALLGIDLVLSAGCLWLLSGRKGESRWAKWGAALFFIGSWLPVGAAHLPLLAYVRGITSDLSVTLVALACLGAFRRWWGLPAVAEREKTALYAVIALAALFLYPMALGWGDWDSYRSGWGGWDLWTALLIVSSLAWLAGLRLLPALAGLALFGWSAGLMETNNLWDYLIDPWLASAALFRCLGSGTQLLQYRFRPAVSSDPNPLN